MNASWLKNCYIASPDDMAFVQALPVEQLPCIACVIPSFNQGKYLAATLDSVLDQGYPAVEIFVADGGSKDNSPEILAEYAQRHPHVLRYDSSPDGGHHHGVNKAIAHTTGDIIAWINSDDLYTPMTFWKVACFFYFNRCALAVFGKSEYVTANLQKICDYPIAWSPDMQEFQRMMMHRCVIPQPSLFFRRYALTLGGTLRSREVIDYELWMRWARKFPLYYYDDLFTMARVHDEAISAKADTTLLKNICKEVHAYYNGVPLSWCVVMAHNKIYGAAWARGENPPMTNRIRLDAVWLFLKLNVCWAPRAARHIFQSLRRFAHEMLRGRV